jgi:hypothetical protein
MKNSLVSLFFLICVSGFLFIACSKKDSSSTDSAVAGRLSSLSVSSLSQKGNETIRTAKTITHVMAVSPSTGNTERFVGAVSSDGTFSLGITSGKPYIIVFIAQDGTLTGPDMVVGTVKTSSHDLDTLPFAQAASADLGDVTVDGGTGEATMTTSISDLISTLGLTSAEADYIGNVDQLALRLSNPDVDSNGVIDSLEGKEFSMDWHVRGDTLLSGTQITMDDIKDQYADASTTTVSWTLTSAYVLYPSSFDSTTYVSSSALANGATFTYAGSAVAPTSYSALAFGDTSGWGADYNMASQEMGASDAVATFVYNLPGSGHTLTFSHVRTKTKAQLSAEGVILPFIKLNTSGGYFTGIDYKWMKRTGSTWTMATVAEVNLLVQSQGAYLGLYTAKSTGVEDGLFFTIPAAEASGTLTIAQAQNTNVSDPTHLTMASFCSSAMSYDDKLGLRIFAGAPAPNGGVATCY